MYPVIRQAWKDATVELFHCLSVRGDEPENRDAGPTTYSRSESRDIEISGKDESLIALLSDKHIHGCLVLTYRTVSLHSKYAKSAALRFPIYR